MSNTDNIDKIDKYFNSPSISQSDLIALSKSPYTFKQKKDNKNTYTSDALVLGSAVDCMLTDNDNWDKRFHVLTVKKPTGQMLEYTERLFNLCSSKIMSYLEVEKSAYELTGFKRDSLEKVQERFQEEGLEYYNELRDSIGKTTISFEIYEKALNIKKDFLDSKYTKEYFTCTEYEKIYFQTPIYFTYNLVECKALIDVIKIDTKNKTITPIDVKTTEFLPNFKDSVWKYRYDLQAAWYTLALNNWVHKSIEYTILPFIFLVAEKCCGNKPWVFKVFKDTLTIGSCGGIISNKEYKGYINLIEEYKECKSKEQWDYPAEMSKGAIRL